MPSTMPNAAMTTPDRTLVTPRPKPVKASLPDNQTQRRLSSVVIDATRDTYGKQGAAAAELGKDEGNFSRDIRAGRTTLRDLADLGTEFLAQLGASLTQEFGAAGKSKAELARERLPEIIRELLELTA